METHGFTERAWDAEDSLGCRSPPATLFEAESLCCLLLGYLLQAALTLSFQSPPTSASQRHTGITDVRVLYCIGSQDWNFREHFTADLPSS